MTIRLYTGWTWETWTRLHILAAFGMLKGSLGRRYLSLHEHYSMDLLRQYGVQVPAGNVAKTGEEAYEVAKKLATEDMAIKGASFGRWKRKRIFR